ncbi:hypothetical protein HYX19_01165 [Candidatus Woesearchaeota archaeon]|nr:hypothetical protein [Candidatus Woesearchaeota archaeon]
MGKIINNISNVFLPLKENIYRKKFFIYLLLFLVLFSIIPAIIISLFLKGFGGNLYERIIFGFIKNIALFTILDWVYYIIATVIATLLVINYSYNKCNDKTSLSTIFLGTISATCPVCILPIVGLLGFSAFIGAYNYLIKSVILIALFIVTIYISNKKSTCKVKRDDLNG